MKKIIRLLILVMLMANFSFIAYADSDWNKEYNQQREWRKHENAIKIEVGYGDICKWYFKDGDWYFINDQGKLSTGWFHVYFSLDENDNMIIDGNDYYADDWGRLQTGWIQDSFNDKWYYLGEDGKLWKNTATPDGYYVGEDGSWLDPSVVVDNTPVRYQPIEIVSTSVNINSVGGASPLIWWQNTSGKEIKYIYFNMVPYNAVGDSRTCQIRGYKTYTGYVTGPIKSNGEIGTKICRMRGIYNPVPCDIKGRIYMPDENGKARDLTVEEKQKTFTEESYWDCAWYNSDISSFKITGISIEYMDGSSQVVNPESVMRLVTNN